MAINLGRLYAVRYYVEPWGKPVPQRVIDKGDRVKDGITVSPDNHGYTDQLIAVSIVFNSGIIGDWKTASMLITDSNTGKIPEKRTLEHLREVIDHMIKKHC